MDDAQLEAMISDLVMEVDYDIWKEVFEDPEDDDMASDLKRRLLAIARRHINE